MARITVPFSGLTSHANHKDGECSNLVNLRPKNGYLKPVAPRKISNTLSQEYKIIFIHRGNTYENWLGVASNKQHLYTKVNTDNPELISLNSSVPFFGLIQDIKQIGNTLTLLTTEGLQYLLWSDNEYKFLGMLPSLPLIKFGLSPETITEKVYYKNVLGTSWMIPMLPGADVDHNEEYKKVNIAMLNKSRQIIVNKKLPSGKATGIKLFDAHIIRYAFRLYDGTVIKHSNPILAMPSSKLLDLNKFYIDFSVENKTTVKSDNSYVSITGYDFVIAYDLSTISMWSDIIKSVDIFISQPLGLTSEEYIKGMNGGELKNLFEEYSEKQIDNIKNNSLFYHSHSLDLVQSQQTFCSTFRSSIDELSKIVHQELMPGDSLSHHNLQAENSVVYNNRLRLSSVTTHLFDGFNVDFFNWRSNYNGQPNQSPVGMHWLHIFVDLNTPEGTKTVRSTVAISQSQPFVLNPYLSYPDPRAVKMSFILTNFDESVVELSSSVDLKIHPSLNVAYYLNTSLTPFLLGGDKKTVSLPSVKTKIFEANKLKVSEINNPFVFPNLNTYQIGSGKILNESSIIMNVSDRNYGMYPVFVFTDNGVFTMAGQTADTVHDSVQAPTYLEPPISDKICATPYGVVFITKRGLMIISQHETKSLSPQLRDDGDNVIFRMPGADDDPVIDLHDKIYPANSITFRDFLSSVSDMIYNPYNDELIISSKENEYCYVYDFPTNSYYISTENITGVVQNSFPDIYVLDGKNVKDYSQKHNGTTNISVITRPLHFGTSDIKTLERTILRALLYKVHSITVIAFHSVDGVRFEPAKGRLVMGDDKNYKDIDLGLLARETYPHYILLVSGTIDDKSQIKYAEFEISKRYDNDKMR